ncbi:MAG TPA: hypothetical protein VFY20_00465 [Gemmatimonadales bacterium]|nr:hypothetical protein [Gemmatimonadales bacterium]
MSEPDWWQRARALEALGRLEEAEAAITDAVPHIGAPASVATLHAERMRRLQAAGDVEGAREARRRAEQWITYYASLATSGGEGLALSRERDAFLAALGREPAGPPPSEP